VELHDAHTQGRLTGMSCVQLALGVTVMHMRSMEVSAGMCYVRLDQLSKNDQIHLFHGYTAKLVEGPHTACRLLCLALQQVLETRYIGPDTMLAVTSTACLQTCCPVSVTSQWPFPHVHELSPLGTLLPDTSRH
jgi:hypothetical protein